MDETSGFDQVASFAKNMMWQICDASIIAYYSNTLRLFNITTEKGRSSINRKWLP